MKGRTADLFGNDPGGGGLLWSAQDSQSLVLTKASIGLSALVLNFSQIFHTIRISQTLKKIFSLSCSFAVGQGGYGMTSRRDPVSQESPQSGHWLAVPEAAVSETERV